MKPLPSAFTLIYLGIIPHLVNASDRNSLRVIPIGETRHPALYHYDKIQKSVAEADLQTARIHAVLRTQHLDLFHGPGSLSSNFVNTHGLGLNERIQLDPSALRQNDRIDLSDKLSESKTNASTILIEPSPLGRDVIHKMLQESYQDFEALPKLEPQQGQPE